MKTKLRVTAVLTGLVASAAALGAETLGEALSETKPIVDWRVRYETVDQTGIAETADAVTSRIRAGFQTGEWGKTSLLGEADWSEDLVDDFNSTTNGQTQYPVVADPGDLLVVNRFALTNKSLDHTTLTFGRQRIIHDNARFVGNVGWRQHEQTYDALRAQTKLEHLDVDLAYVDQVNRVFGPDSPAGKWNGDIVLGNVSHPTGWGSISAFAYHLDLDEAAVLSSDTVGLKVTGSRTLDPLKLLYTLTLARQTDAGANPSDYSETYAFVEGGLGIAKFTVALGLEQLGSDGVNSVTTPLATLHAFQGWADKFLGTPVNGIDDTFLRFAYQPGAVGPFQSLSVATILHEFDADFGSAHYGDEIDFQVAARWRQMTFTLKYAAYEADTLFTDTDKFWVSMDYAF